MRIVRERASAAQAFAACQAEAGAAFGSSEIYCEKYIEQSRHVEVQVLGDRNGMRVHLGERDCSVQRRHQKLIEESPAPSLPAETRAGLHRAALLAAAAVNYVSAGTVEFLVDAEGAFYFIEMNTRIQVEHPVTEAIDRMRRALQETVIEGVKTTIPFHLKTLSDPAFIEGRFTTADVGRLHP